MHDWPRKKSVGIQEIPSLPSWNPRSLRMEDRAELIFAALRIEVEGQVRPLA